MRSDYITPPPAATFAGSFLRPIRSVARGLVEGVSVGTGADRLGRWLSRGSATVLAYHNVVPDELAGKGDASLHLPLSVFRQHLDLIREQCRPLSLSEFLSGTWSSAAGLMPVTITFDDAYRGLFDVGLPELAERAIPATLFVAPGILGDRTLWWDALATSSHGAVEPDVRESILRSGGTEAPAREVASQRSLQWLEMPELIRTVTEEELREYAAAHRGLTFASHSWSHAPLDRLSEPALGRELGRSRDWLRTCLTGSYIDAMSYPYGLHSPAVHTATAMVGYEAALALGGGRLAKLSSDVRFRIPRMNIPAGLSVAGMSHRLGWK
jgi:peptidoglycan/xylan/chitin deacetylase (PgdA/CDA1 family)